ncbi:MAG: membrane protein insertion efficiency factor YidD [Hyphomicrobiaceae bacterium]|nr:MAG: membrane protein insertion efficiency factor YidD [Hyphomicrobiaceae bacterium]
MAAIARLPGLMLKLPVHAYRWTLKPWLGHECRYLPTCSEYALDAIDKNGAWRGFWLMLSRVLSCHPWGGSGYDPAPDLGKEGNRPLAPWKLWRRRAEGVPATASADGASVAPRNCRGH